MQQALNGYKIGFSFYTDRSLSNVMSLPKCSQIRDKESKLKKKLDILKEIRRINFKRRMRLKFNDFVIKKNKEEDKDRAK